MISTLLYFYFKFMSSLLDSINAYVASAGYVSRFEKLLKEKHFKPGKTKTVLVGRLDMFVFSLGDTIREKIMKEKLSNLYLDADFLKCDSQTAQIQYFYNNWGLSYSELSFIFNISS